MASLGLAVCGDSKLFSKGVYGVFQCFYNQGLLPPGWLTTAETDAARGCRRPEVQGQGVGRVVLPGEHVEGSWPALPGAGNFLQPCGLLVRASLPTFPASVFT